MRKHFFRWTTFMQKSPKSDDFYIKVPQISHRFLRSRKRPLRIVQVRRGQP
nr:MAG TPA: hypothetical protein [Caudoviricetes sp.]